MASLILSAVLYGAALVQAQSAAGNSTNTNPDCRVAAFIDAGGPTYFYRTSDVDNVGINLKSAGTCDTGSFAAVTLRCPSNTYTCDNLALDGNTHLISCPISRGIVEEGQCFIDIQTDPGVNFAQVSFTLTHAQVTSTAPTPTSTFTITPTETATTTTTTTQTETISATPQTVTRSASTRVRTSTVRPSPFRSTTTRTLTLASRVISFTLQRTTVTSTASCSGTTSIIAPQQSGSPPQKRSIRSYPVKFKQLDRRAPNGGEGIYGDGPATTTVTPDPVLTTTTAGTTTSTFTSTSAGAVVTRTVAANPATVTSISGTKMTSTTTTTLSRQTFVRTAFTLTRVKTTTTVTFSLKKVSRTTPACTPTGAPQAA